MNFLPDSAVIATGLDSPEGPACLDDGSWLVVEMGSDRGCVTHVDVDGSLRVICTTGRPNGLALADDGSVLVAESMSAAILRIGTDWHRGLGEPSVVSDDAGGLGPMLFPNDLCFGPDGYLYVTDSGLPLEVMQRELLSSSDPATLPFDGRVYRIDVETGATEVLDSGLGHLNGISVGIDEALYTNDTVSGDVYRYPFTNAGIGAREVFGNVIDPSGSGFRGPDGMAHDVQGNLYVAVFNQGEVIVLDRDGDWAERIPTYGTQPTNLAFCPGERAIYVTERETGTLQRLPALAPGKPLPYQIAW